MSDNEADLTIAERVSELLHARLIVTPWGVYDPNVSVEVIDYNPTLVIIIGGPIAVVERYEQDLQSFGISYTRLYGQTRVETAIKVIEFIQKDYPDLLKNSKFFAVYGWDLASITKLREIMESDKEVIPIFVGPNSTSVPVNVTAVIVSDESENILKKIHLRNAKVIRVRMSELTVLQILERANTTLLRAKSLAETSEDQRMLHSAEDLLLSAEHAYKSGDYEKAYRLATRAMTIAQVVIAGEGTKKELPVTMRIEMQLKLMSLLMDKLEARGEDVSQARYYLELAKRALETGRVGDAMIYLEKARDAVKAKIRGRKPESIPVSRPEKGRGGKP
ncbi:Uncharacterized protein MJ0755 precursor [Thermococcus chitonophagus]|uniref:Uncharacterized protein MJ0755 n=1 Tax=Thermococcus chitonophagus TaxID=54262 RepID=A0A160VUJ1_9EURY|nr:Uncharacterized protein MJ0755 precursor [Thermococcus chitonophagus]